MPFPESRHEKISEFQSEINRIDSVLLTILPSDEVLDLISDIQATAILLNGIITEIIASLEKQKQTFEYDGQLLTINNTAQPLYDGIHYLHSITAESLRQAYDFNGGVTGVIKQVEKTKDDLTIAIQARDRYH